MKPKHKRVWSVYIVRCSDGTLYTGMTINIKRRLGAHNSGRGARYTRGRRPVRLVYQKNSMTKAQAMTREHAVKSMSKKAKENLVR